MPGLMQRLFGQPPRDVPGSPRQIRLAEMPPVTYAVGDIHGCLDLYRKLEAQIVAQAAGTPVLIVLLGDLVDRGPDSAGVLDFVMAPAPKGVQRLVLMGNHEHMMLRFLEAPRANMRWLEYGGRETLASYGIYGDYSGGFDMPERRLRQMFDASIPTEHIDWLGKLPAALHLGTNYFLAHAGIDPEKPLVAQTANDLMWSRGMTTPPPDGITVIHGHTPVNAVTLNGPYINIDTGAYATGRLSALRLVQGETPQLLEMR